MTNELGKTSHLSVERLQEERAFEGAIGQAIRAAFESGIRGLAGLDSRARLAVVVPMWRERSRLLPSGPDNPHGEDAFARKLIELDAVFSQTNVDWRVYFVDDGCPEHSGNLVRDLARHGNSQRVVCIDLADAIPSTKPPLSRLRTVEDSAKGGALVLGSLRAIEDGCDLIAYTDCDTSASLLQLGRLLAPMLADEGVGAVLGSRYHPSSLYAKNLKTGLPGIRTMRLLPRLLCPGLYAAPYIDTQAPLKVFRAKVLEEVIEGLVSLDFSIDTDITMQLIQSDVELRIAPLVFSHSPLLSTVSVIGLARVLKQLSLGLAVQAESHGFPVDPELAAFVRSPEFSEEAIDRIVVSELPSLAGIAEHDIYGGWRLSTEAFISELRSMLA